MNNSTIYDDFDKSINWNAYLYIIQKVLMVFCTSLFFKVLTPIEFSIWANISSVIFLLLLWIDFGFRKSVPCFIPEFSKDKAAHINFTKLIIKWQLGAIAIAVLFFIIISKVLSYAFFKDYISGSLFYIIIGMFILEGVILLLRLIYHSHFWNKEFNLIYSLVIVLEAIINIFLLSSWQGKLINIFLVKITLNSLLVVFAVSLLKKLYYKKEYSLNKTGVLIDYKKTKKDFLKHSFMMWVSSILKSLSERNFLIPLITISISPVMANLFKLSNDWALLFQRSILKTIGSSDTSLFSHANLNGGKDNINNALKKVISKIIYICIPLLVVLVLIILNKDYFIGKDQFVFKLFLILVSFYIAESILSPYERLLEVHKKYHILSIAYLPFILFITCTLILASYNVSISNLLTFLLILCSVRLVSFLILILYTHKQYNFHKQFNKQY